MMAMFSQVGFCMYAMQTQQLVPRQQFKQVKKNVD